MSRGAAILWSWAVTLAIVLALALGVKQAFGALPGMAAPKLQRVVADVSGHPVKVRCARLSVGTIGEASEGYLRLDEREVCSVLRAAPRLIEDRYGRNVSSGWAVFTLAHEVGHAIPHPDAGLWEEAHADCYAARTWRRYARRLGFGRAQLPAMAKQLGLGTAWAAGCWGPEAARHS